MKRCTLLAIAIGLLTLAIDQASKLWIIRTFSLGESRPLITGLFNLSYVQNRGAAWGIFQGSQLPLAIMALLAIVLFCLFWKQIFGPRPSNLPILGLLIGGILGNLIDRLCRGYVIDFLHVHFRTWNFPCFNIADSAICTAVAIFLLLQFIHRDNAH